MALETNTEVGEIESVKDRNGDVRPPANADEQEITNEKLGNADSVFSDKLDPSTGGESLPSHSVKEGQEVLLMADPANGGIIYVGEPGSASVPLTGGNGLTLQVSNTDVLEAQASETGQTLHIIAEGGA